MAEDVARSGAAGEDGGDSHPPKQPKTLDDHVYAFETGIVTGALLLMALTYVLKIINRDMTAAASSFDKLVLRFMGYETTGEVDPATFDQVTGVITPLILTGVTYLLVVLALRTRWHLQRERDAERRDNGPVGRWFALSIPITAALYGLLKVVEVVPAQWLCLVGLVAMTVPAVLGTWRSRNWGALAGVLLGGLLLAWFFVTHAGESYTWNDKLSLVMLMYVGFLGGSMATRDEKHITVDAVRKLVPRKHLHLYNALGNLLTIAFLVFLGVLTAYFTGTIGVKNTIEGLQLPYYLITLPIVISLVLMVLRFAKITWRDLGAWRRGELPEETGPELH